MGVMGGEGRAGEREGDRGVEGEGRGVEREGRGEEVIDDLLGRKGGRGEKGGKERKERRGGKERKERKRDSPPGKGPSRHNELRVGWITLSTTAHNNP